MTDLGLVSFETDDSGAAPRIQTSGLVNGSTELFGRVDDTTFGGTFNRIHFPFQVISFGGDFFSTTSGDGLVVSFAGESLLFSDYLENGNGFLGVISDVPFNQITFTPAGLPLGEGFNLDNISFHAVPEPSTCALLILALFVRLVRSRRKRAGHTGGQPRRVVVRPLSVTRRST